MIATMLWLAPSYREPCRLEASAYMGQEWLRRRFCRTIPPLEMLDRHSTSAWVWCHVRLTKEGNP